MTNDEFESDTSFSKGNRNANDGSGPATPHRSKRINLGTPANYYFKYMNSSKKSASNDLSIRKDEDEDNTGTISIPGFQIGGDNAKTETSFFSMAGSSTASEGSVDLLNKSTLSDTTELTASNFVLVTTSKQNMVQGIRELKARAQKKENVENGKDATEQAQSVPMKQRENATADNLKTTLSGHMPENDIEPPSSKVHQSQQEVPRKLQQQPMKSASPSLRSRISSSPASLRKFHENLKNSRMRRQQQREEDTKRRLSIEADNTIDSMNAQLEALTKHSSSNRKRLPPPFTQLSQESPSQESSLEVSSRQASPAASSTDATATINIADLDDLLGIEVPTRRGNQESTKKHISAVQHALNDENSTSSILAKDDTPALQANANEMEISSTPNRTSSFIENSRFGEESKIESKPCSLDVKTQYSSPSSTNASLKLRSASSNQRKRMTPSNLSSTPQRVVNPRSVFSPASNTRSAKKRRKLLEEEEKLHASSAISAVIITRNEPSKIGTCLFHKASTTENDSSIESESSGMVTGTQRDQGDGDSPIGNDDTASLGEIADIFGSNGTNSITSPDVEAGELYHYNSKETGYKAEYQETASITDINDLIKQGFPPSQEFSGRAEIEESLLSTDESRVSQDPGYDDAKQLENKNMHTVQETRHFLSSDDSNSSSALKEGNGSALKEIRETIADELGPVLEDNTSSISPQSNVLCTPPDTQEIASQSNLSSESQHSLHSTKEFPKSPIRLTPNNRKKLTPSKLGPTPRRVMNPMNPNSPARNTRNSLKSSRSLDSSGLNSVLGGEPSKDCAPAEDQPDSVGNEEVVRFGKRRQSLSLQPITRQVAEPLHFEDKPFKKLPSGILSSKKKPFSRRSVAFGSPEAAEYNIGSPSVSLTPMPKGRAKALFALPAKCGISLENEIHKNQTENQTNQYTEDELGMDVLIDKITVEQMNNSPKLSPIEKRKTDTDVFQVPSNMMSIQGNLCCEDRTVELESGMQLLLAKNMKELEKQHSLNTKHSPSVSPVECRDNSVELTDSESIASIHSKYEKYTADLVLPIDAQRLDFSHVSETSKRDYSSADVEDGKTVELEGNMLSLLHATCSKEGDTEQKSIPNNDNMEMSVDSAPLMTNNDTSQQFTGNLKSMSSITNVGEGRTVELEGNMMPLLQATTSGDTEKESIAADKMEMSVDSASLMTNNDISQQSTGNLKSMNSNANVEDGKTVELEGNILSLLQATNSGDTEKESIAKNKMETSVDSAFLMTNNDNSQQFTGILKSMSSIANVEDDKTMELEGNMLSLLQATESGDNEKESIPNDNMEMRVDSASLMVKKDISQQFTGNLKSMNSNANVGDSKTMELEGNILSLLQATNSGDTEQEEDKMETSVDSASFMRSNDISQKFTGNLKSMSSIANVEDDKTMELEGNMLTLLQAACCKEGGTEQESIAKDKMEISVDAASLMINNDISQKFTGNLKSLSSNANVEGSKTVELEGNMSSLLQTTDACQKEGKINIDGMDLATEASTFTTSVLIGDQKDDNLIPESDSSDAVVSKDKIKTGKDENALIDKDGMDADLSSSIVTEVRPQSPGSSNINEACRIDTRFDVTETSDVKARRRKSLSSKSFTLDRIDQSQSIMDDITAEQRSLIVDKSVSFSDTTEFITTLTGDFESNEYTVKDASINIASFTSKLFEGLTYEESREDGLSDSFSKFGKSDGVIGRIICERWGQFIEAVCGEVERRTDLEGTAAASLISVVKDDPDFFSVIQNKIQCSGDSSDIQKSLKNLVQAGQTLIEYEWNSWLVTVLESFYGPLNDIPQIFANDETKLDEAFQHCKNMQIDISFMSDRKTKRARRKSLLRHQSLVTKLEVEIDTIEAQLSTIRSELEEIEREENDIFKATTDCQGIHQEAEFCDDLKSKAESSQKTFLSLRGLHSWSIGTISEQDLEFSTIGSCPHTHLKLLYKGTKFGKASTNLLSKSDATHLIAKSLHAYQGSIASFLEMATRRLMSMSSESNENGSIRISHHLQKYTWHIGRLDLVAKEFQVVQRRFNGKLCRNGAEGIFSFIVEFESEKSIIVADFTIEPVYPSFPVEVRLDLISGEQDLERVRRALVKNAKPGFGSLSRACDIIQSIVRGKGGVN